MSNVDYYQVLNIPPTATPTQIRDAYKRAALLTHPDRVSHTDPSRASRTARFQTINDAYYTLSDPARRREYDRTRHASPPPSDSHDSQFNDIFEEMMEEEGLGGGAGAPAAEGRGSVWSVLGGVSGAAIGFIVANVPGLLAGAVAGNRLGAVRDRKGKSVHEAFQELPQDDKAKLLSTLATKILAHAVSA